MSFNMNRFRQEAGQLKPRTADVAVPDLQYWFGDAPAVWTVRGLTGREIAIANDVERRAKTYLAAAEAFASAARSDQADALKALFGADGSVPEDLAKRFDHLTFGSVEPAISREDAVALFAAHPIVAYQLSNKVLELTGLGPELGKAPHSTAAPMS